MWTLPGIGYLTRSDSEAYSNRTRERGVRFETTSYGMPIGRPWYVPDPKSACSPSSRPMEATMRCESRATGSRSTGRLVGKERGSIGQFGAPGSGAADAVAGRAARRMSRAAGIFIGGGP
jgi:hypothetical protein